MERAGFSGIASRYEMDALLQRSAAHTLIDLVGIGPEEDVLDVGCGTGQLTAKIRQITNGRVVGVDPAEGMIREARSRYGGLGIEFETGSAEDLSCLECFDVVFSNSSFQWFTNPDLAIAKWHRALRKGGRVGLQAPAKQDYSPTFIQAMRSVEEHPATGSIFRHFRNRCFALETQADYEALFTRAGFAIAFARLDAIKTLHTAEEAFSAFGSGAAVAYLNPSFYDVPIDDGYGESVLQLVKGALERMADDRGIVEVIFHRIFLLAVRT